MRETEHRIDNDPYLTAERCIGEIVKDRSSDLANAYRRLGDLEIVLEDALRTLVAQDRAAGWSWTDIGANLGTTRQAAQQRFGH